MELTRRCDYAFRILRCAYRHQEGFISIAEVAAEEDIPYAFARTIQHDLAMAGFVRTVRGARGGLTLAIDPAEVTVLDLLRSLQGPISVAQCSRNHNACPRSHVCTFHDLWVAADEALATLFGAVSLKQILDGEKGGPFLDEARLKAETVVSASLAELAGGVDDSLPCDCE